MRIAHEAVHLGEVGRHETDVAGGEVWPRHVRQEVRDVFEPGAELTAQVRPVVDGVHLMDADLVESWVACSGSLLDRVEHGGRLAVRRGAR